MNTEGAAFAAAIFLSSLGVCLIPKVMTTLGIIKRMFPFLTLTTAGFLLGVQLMELSPHILQSCHGHGEEHKEETAHPHDGSSMAGFFVAGLSFIFLLGIDTIVLKHKHCDEELEREKHRHEEDTHSHQHGEHSREGEKAGDERLGCCDTNAIRNMSSKTQVFIYILGISIHSFFEGLAFNSVDKIGSLEIGLVFHKVLESFALGVPLFTSGLGFGSSLGLAVFYSALTPAGMVIGASHPSQRVKSIFNGLALGSIMFIVSVEMIPPMFNHSKGRPFFKILTLLAGYLLSGVVIGSSHVH